MGTFYFFGFDSKLLGLGINGQVMSFQDMCQPAVATTAFARAVAAFAEVVTVSTGVVTAFAGAVVVSAEAVVISA